MNHLLHQFINNQQSHNKAAYLSKLKEAIQSLALLGLWRANFFDHAAFYGGTCLRILYGLNRFSEDLDFSLLKPQADFDLTRYLQAIENEMKSFGLSMTACQKQKVNNSPIISAFIKGQTYLQFLNIEVPKHITQHMYKNECITIKFEIDIDPPGDFQTEIRPLYHPIPFFVRSYQQPDLFAGKMHALLCRTWKTRMKGRDWFDFIWYVSNNIPLHTDHLRQRLIQSGHLQSHENFEHTHVIELLLAKLAQIDITLAKEDVLPFVSDSAVVACWSRSFFEELSGHIQFV